MDDIQTVLDIGTDFSGDLFINELNELKKKLEENKFYLVVTGLFKRGKSSVINTLIRKNIAPVAVTPVTAVITLFEYGRIARYEVKFMDNQRKDIAPEEICLYVAEEENPQNEMKISQVTVYVDDCELLKKCCIVDTPGLGSVFEHNSETTYQYVPKIDAALFVLSADIPISKTDADFLREIHFSVPRIIYVLNKTDLLTEIQIKELIRFNTGIIAGITEKDENDIVIVPVSCKLEGENRLNGNFGELEMSIERMIEESKMEVLAETGQRRLRHIAITIRQLLTIKANTLQMPVKIIEEKQFSLKQSVEVMNETRNEFDILVKGQLNNILEKHLEKADELLLELRTQSKQNVLSLFDSANIIDNKTINELSLKLSEDIVSRLEDIKEIMEKEIIEEFNRLLEKYRDRTLTFLNEFTRMLDELFGLSFETVSGRFDLDVYTSFYFLKFIDGQSVESKLPVVYRFLPEKLKYKRVLSIFFKNAEILIEVNKNRMKSDIIYRVNESFRKFKTEENKQVGLIYERIYQLLKEAIANKTKSKKETDEDLQNIARKIEILNNIA